MDLGESANALSARARGAQGEPTQDAGGGYAANGRSRKPEKRDELETEFESWYSAYPRREGRGQAFRAYRAARKKVSAEILLSAVKRDALRFEGKERQFIPHPATWLNGERWADDTQQPNSKPVDWRSVL